MAEQFVDYTATTTVGSSGYTAGSGTLEVTSTAAPFPSAPTFSLLVVNNVTGLSIVELRVSAVTNSTHWAVTPVGTDVSAPAGSYVFAVFGKDSLLQMRKDRKIYGAYASRPTTPSEGDTYQCSDGPIEFYYNGSAWIPFYSNSKQLVLPVQANLVSIHTGSHTITDTGIGVTATGGVNDYSFFRTNLSTSTPSTLTVAFQVMIGSEWYGAGGMIAYDHTGGANDGKLYDFHFESNSSNISFVINKYNTGLSYVGNLLLHFVQSSSFAASNQLVWLRVRDTGTTRYYEYSGNGYDWSYVYSEASSTWYTPNEAGWWVNGSPNYGTCFSLYHIDAQPT